MYPRVRPSVWRASSMCFGANADVAGVAGAPLEDMFYYLYYKPPCKHFRFSIFYINNIEKLKN
jgi:hypothetical protein